MTALAERYSPSGVLKRRMRQAVDVACRGSGLLRWSELRMRRGLTILMYHRVLPLESCRTYPLESLVIPVDVFDRQMAWLAGNFAVLPVREALEQLAETAMPDRPFVAVSFDDGYADNHVHAAPVLARHGLRGTFFVTTGFVESGEPTWFDRAADLWTHLDDQRRSEVMGRLVDALESSSAEAGARAANAGSPDIGAWMAGLKKLSVADRERFLALAEPVAIETMEPGLYAPMTPIQVTELHQQGHEIASHSVSHPILTRVDDGQLSAELRNSRERLAEWTGAPVTGLCYPNGDCDRRVITAAREAGYSYGCATSSGVNLPGQEVFSLHRRSITMHRTMRADGGHDAAGFRGEVSGLRDWWR